MEVGSAVTLTNMMAAMQEQIATRPKHEVSSFLAVVNQLRCARAFPFLLGLVQACSRRQHALYVALSRELRSQCTVKHRHQHVIYGTLKFKMISYVNGSLVTFHAYESAVVFSAQAVPQRLLNDWSDTICDSHNRN